MSSGPTSGGPPPPDGLRSPPHNDDAERNLLGAILMDPRALDEVSATVDPEDFYRESHRHIFRAMCALAARGDDIDAVSMNDYLDAEGVLDSVGGPNAVVRLSNEVVSAVNVGTYANIVRRKSALRSFIRTADSLVDECFDDVPDVEAFLDEAESKIFQITQRGQARGYSSMRDVIREAFTQIEAQYQKSEAVTGVSSSFVDLDRITSGWQASDLIIMAARPAMGKTALTLNMLVHAAVERKTPAAFFSLEMSNHQLAIRMLCSQARIDQGKLRTGQMTEQEWAKLLKAAGSLSDAKIFLDDTPSLPIMEFRSKARRLKAEHDIGIIFIDYLQLMRGSAAALRSGSREQEISDISRNLKAVAKELNIPIIALAQLNRGVEQRADKRPMMSDLRESGAIEQDADLICFIYRDEVYNPDTERKGIAEIIIGKHRNGAIGTVNLRFFNSFTRFENLAPEDY